MGKIDRKGRSKSEPFIRLHRGVTGSAAWKSLSCEARALLLLVWERHNGTNNGAVPLSHREARDALRIGNDKLQKAFIELQDKGFLIARQKGSFNWKVASGAGRATEWEITTEQCGGNPPDSRYRNWGRNQNAVPDPGANGAWVRNNQSQGERP